MPVRANDSYGGRTAAQECEVIDNSQVGRNSNSGSSAAGVPSVLFLREADRQRAQHAEPPKCFPDLHLNRIVASVLSGKEEYDLQWLFYHRLRDRADIEFRQEAMRDISRPELHELLQRFAETMRTMRMRLSQAERLHHELQKQRWHLDSALSYCEALERLNHDLEETPPVSAGLCRFRAYLDGYISSVRFGALRADTGNLRRKFATLRYTILIDGLRVTVGRANEKPDYGVEISGTFEPFEHAGDDGYRFEFHDADEMNAVESAIAERVAELWPDTFAELGEFSETHENFADREILEFNREIQFYLSFIDYLLPFKKAGLDFCFPRLSRDSKAVSVRGGFDLALAERLLDQDAVPVCNDFQLEDDERIIVVSGPNQSGKTTFARLFGQLHYLASLGYPVPGVDAQLFICDEIFTHFERGEPAEQGRGKLQDDMARIHTIVECATSASIVILNEIFSSTTARDASELGLSIMEKLTRLDVLGVWVTFLDELASANPKVVSMVGAVDTEDPARRTYRIKRGAPEGLAYALSLAEKQGLTSACLARRLPR